MELIRLLNANELVAQIICFLVILTIMRVFLWKKFLAIIDKRKETIAAQLKDAEDTKSQAAKLKRDYETLLSGIDDERRARIQQAADEARTVANQIIAKAEEDGEKLIDNARSRLRDEVTSARQALKNDIVDLAMQAAEKIVQEKISKEGDRRIVEEFINDLKNT